MAMPGKNDLENRILSRFKRYLVPLSGCNFAVKERLFWQFKLIFVFQPDSAFKLLKTFKIKLVTM